jgi:hypothetical protein
MTRTLAVNLKQIELCCLSINFLKRAKKKVKNRNGDAGYRSPCLSHAKRALYHLSYIPGQLDVNSPAQA